VILTDEQADSVALWSIYTHAYDAFDTSPKLVVKSPQKRSGKTRLVEILSRITARPLSLSGIRPAALLRLIATHRPALLIDEMDAAMKGDRELFEALRGIINSGFDRTSARYIVNVPLPNGGYEPRAFSTWCPQLLSGIGDLPETVRDRAIEIDMQRKRRDQKVKRLRRRDGGELHEIARKAARWTADSMAVLREAVPIMPTGLHDRAADAWEPLVVLADLAGRDWPQRARKAALSLSGDGAVEDDNIGSMLLADIREVFETKATDRLASSDLTDALSEMKDRPWSDWRNGKAITQNGLARLLRPYRDANGRPIAPETIRTTPDRTAKGYRRSQFEEAFTRYAAIPPHSNRNSVTSPIESTQLAHSQPSHGSGLLRFENGERSNNSGHCYAVTVEEPSDAQEGDEWTL
jgi:putative DNA primase/helicase